MEGVVQVAQCTFVRGKSLLFQVSSQQTVALLKTGVVVAVPTAQTLVVLVVAGA
jgi:hypothetical protein